MTDRWQDALENEELKISPVLDRYKTQEDAMLGLVEARSTLGRSFTMLNKDATPEERQAWIKGEVIEKLPELMVRPSFDTDEGAAETWKMLGVPGDDGYTNPEDMGGLNEDLVPSLKDIAKELGMTQKQYAKYVEVNARMSAEGVELNTTALATHETERKGKWGAADEQNMSITDTLVEKFQDPDNPLGELNNGARYFIMNIAKALSSDPQVFNQLNEPQSKMTPAEGRAELADMRRSPIYHNRENKYSKKERMDFLNRYNNLLAESTAGA